MLTVFSRLLNYKWIVRLKKAQRDPLLHSIIVINLYLILDLECPSPIFFPNKVLTLPSWK